MSPRTPLLLVAIALPFTGCTCEWHASTSKSWSTNSGGERVVVVQEDPYQAQRERDARIAREREWERERDRERARHPVVIGSGGRTSTGAAPHSPALGQPSVQPSPGASSYPGVSGGSSGSIAAPAPAPIVPPPVTPTPAPVVTPTPAPPPEDSYVAPREINKPSGGPGKAATPTDTDSADKKKPAQPRTGRMTRPQ
ncbi:MAG TPA: hypothetical protein VFX59_04500 [Polyangiales bacterium]|nr:hypothetical protein [Polyangiales bacterium]